MDRRTERLGRQRAPLQRLPDEGWIAGTCAGLSRYLGIDASLVRIVAVFGLLSVTGITMLVYLLAWAIVPSQHDL